MECVAILQREESEAKRKAVADHKAEQTEIQHGDEDDDEEGEEGLAVKPISCNKHLAVSKAATFGNFINSLERAVN